MNFSECLRRADLNSIATFLLHGGEKIEPPSPQTYEERLAAARKKGVAFFRSRYPDSRERDEIAEHFHELATVFEEVYFEIGLLLGWKIGNQLRERMEELSQ